MKKKKSFSQKVYKIIQKVPKGKLTTYKAVAEKLNTKAYQAVGQALKRNPNPPTIPCHRVIKTDGTIGGFGGKTKGKNIKTKKELLTKEGIKFKKDKIIDLKKLITKL